MTRGCCEPSTASGSKGTNRRSAVRCPRIVPAKISTFAARRIGTWQQPQQSIAHKSSSTQGSHFSVNSSAFFCVCHVLGRVQPYFLALDFIRDLNSSNE